MNLELGAYSKHTLVVLYRCLLLWVCLVSSSQSFAKPSAMQGTWVEQGAVNAEGIPIHVFSLEITQANQILKGEYCYVSNYGRRDDCHQQIVGHKVGINRYRVTFDSGFGAKQGIAELYFKAKQLRWTLIQAPKSGDYMIPSQAVLRK